MLYYNLFKSNWILNKGTGTNQIACWNDLTHASKTGTQCPPLSEIKANVNSGYTVTVRGNYSNTQLVKYSDITYTAKSTSITYDVQLEFYVGTIGYDLKSITMEFPQFVNPNGTSESLSLIFENIIQVPDTSLIDAPAYASGMISNTWTLKSGVNPSDNLQVNYTVKFNNNNTSLIRTRIFMDNPMHNFGEVNSMKAYSGYDGSGNILKNEPTVSEPLISVIITADNNNLDNIHLIGQFNTTLNATVNNLTTLAGIGLFPCSSPTEWTD